MNFHSVRAVLEEANTDLRLHLAPADLDALSERLWKAAQPPALALNCDTMMFEQCVELARQFTDLQPDQGFVHGNSVSYILGDHQYDVPMTEIAPGIYQGTVVTPFASNVEGVHPYNPEDYIKTLMQNEADSS